MLDNNSALHDYQFHLLLNALNCLILNRTYHARQGNFTPFMNECFHNATPLKAILMFICCRHDGYEFEILSFSGVVVSNVN